MDVSGQLKQLIWMDNTQQWLLFWSQPGQQCEVHAYCGAFGSCNQNSLPYCHCLEGFEPKLIRHWRLNDYSEGCVRKTKLKCEDHVGGDNNNDMFLANLSVVLPEHPKLISASSIHSIEECKMACLANCSCTAYTYDASGCSIWFGDLLNMKQVSDDDPNGRTLYTRLAASELHREGHKILVMGILMGLGMGILDPRLEGNADRDEVIRMCKLACWCIQDEESQRPSMGQALQVLEGFLDVNVPLLPRSLKMFADDDEVSFMSPSEFLLSLESTGTSSYDSIRSSVPDSTTSSAIQAWYSGEVKKLRAGQAHACTSGV
ncbi:hypothetical protein Cgig2_012360 [Carnegiea gigantea]|uniref:Apple domain-containing protein n=1 Tax=Carnegiea gigantea TaxID=171969 RepID=A0A9Q1KNK0_9CARY|nr:hypothetical protein Cgig2_012360 [Carnegiea gigantea]